MKKIPSLFKRQTEGFNRNVYDELTEGTEWVLDSGATATRKYDGTCCLVRQGTVYRRYEVKKDKKPPPGFEPATEIDPNTGKQQGWIAVGDGPNDQYHREALKCYFQQYGHYHIPDGTYELCGPKLQGNPELFANHTLVPHGKDILAGFPTDFDLIRQVLSDMNIEGVVWHHRDGRMAKIKLVDFGLKRRAPEEYLLNQ